MKPLTAKQQAVLDYFLDYHRKNYSWPSLREAGAHFGIRHGAIHRHTKALETKGYLIPYFPSSSSHQRGWTLPKGDQ